ncbi:MAG: MerR family DNA-binding transcriptional regulator, partial [Clostridia bacterium]|nr:MerR family DNA-binding transcriptional regulator [Clostridia bacterium]
MDATSSSIIKAGGVLVKLYDISEVCKILGTTSRTLRYYEE